MYVYHVGCFLKSQKKRDPEVCDELLFRLWCSWEDAFPGISFNKYHGLFCAVRRYAHKFLMTGRISEESGEAYNATQEEVKRILRGVVSHKKRVDKMTERIFFMLPIA